MSNQIFYAVQICFEHADDLIIMFKKFEDALAGYRKECQEYERKRKIVLKKFDLSIRGYDSENKIEENEVK